MTAKVPSLSSAGWIAAPADKADQLLSYYFVADASQTHFYRGRVVSLPAQVQQNGMDEQQLRLTVRSDLQRLLEPYFDEVILDVRTDLPNPEDPNRINITVNCIVAENGEKYSLGRMVSTENSKITNIVNINNFQGS